MKILIKDLEANPYRDIKNYPIDREKIESLKTSIKETSFWDNVVIRKKPGDDKYQLAYGHHRWIALKELGLKEVDLPVRDLDDCMMIKIMANENLDSWKTNPSVIIETVRVAKDFLDGELRKYETWEEFKKSKSSLIELLMMNKDDDYAGRKFQEIKTRGVGQTTLLKFLGGNWKQWYVQEALAMIKDRQVDIEAVKKFNELGPARVFADAVKQYHIPKQEQKALAERIVKEESREKSGRKAKKVGQRAIPSIVEETAKLRGYIKKEKKEKSVPDFFDRVEEATSKMGEANTILKKLKNHLQYLDNSFKSRAFCMELKYLEQTVDQVSVIVFEKQAKFSSKESVKLLTKGGKKDG